MTEEFSKAEMEAVEVEIVNSHGRCDHREVAVCECDLQSAVSLLLQARRERDEAERMGGSPDILHEMHQAVNAHRGRIIALEAEQEQLRKLHALLLESHADLAERARGLKTKRDAAQAQVRQMVHAMTTALEERDALMEAHETCYVCENTIAADSLASHHECFERVRWLYRRITELHAEAESIERDYRAEVRATKP